MSIMPLEPLTQFITIFFVASLLVTFGNWNLKFGILLALAYSIDTLDLEVGIKCKLISKQCSDSL